MYRPRMISGPRRLRPYLLLCSPFLSVKLCIRCTRRNRKCRSSASRLVTVPTELLPTAPFLSEWAKCQPGSIRNGGTVLPIANLMADSESGSPDSYLSFLVTIHLSRLVSEIFACDRQTGGQTDNADHCYSCPPHCGGPAENMV